MDPRAGILDEHAQAQCPRARMDLIERDPIGVGLYGDLRRFSHDEKRALLNTLKRVGVQA